MQRWRGGEGKARERRWDGARRGGREGGGEGSGAVRVTATARERGGERAMARESEGDGEEGMARRLRGETGNTERIETEQYIHSLKKFEYI